MTVKVDLSKLLQHTDWPTHLSQAQRQQLIDEKFRRAHVYHFMATGNLTQQVKEHLCLTQQL